VTISTRHDIDNLEHTR